jgi:hypothetical protein
MVVTASAADTITWRPETPPANTGFWSNACSTPSAKSAPGGVHTGLQDDDSSVADTLSFVPGESASDVAWHYSPSTGTEAGPVVSLPSSVTDFSARVRGASSGRIVVYYKASSSTYYVGVGSISATAGSWSTVDTKDGLLWWENAPNLLGKKAWSPVYPKIILLDPTNQPQSLGKFIKDRVKGGSLLASVQLGCDGDFDIDHLTVTTGSGSADYDLTNQSSRSTLLASSTRVRAGGAVQLTGRVTGAFTRATPAGGTTELQELPYGASTWSTVGTGTSFTVRPNGTTSYRLHYSGSTAATASTSGKVTVEVVTGVSANLASTSVTRGKVARVTGRVAPGNSGVKVSLQRKVGKAWKTVHTARTTAGGAYSVGTKVKKEGRWTVRVVASSARGNLAGVSPTRTFTVRTATRVSLSASTSSVLTGHKYKLRGKARPHKKGVKVTLQRRTATGWAKVATTRTSRKGTFSFTRRAGAPGATTYRVVVAHWAFKATGVSPARTVVVRSPAPPPPPPTTGGGGGGTGIGGGGGTGIG